MTNRSCWLKRFANQLFGFHCHKDLEVPYFYGGKTHFHLLDKIIKSIYTLSMYANNHDTHLKTLK